MPPLPAPQHCPDPADPALLAHLAHSAVMPARRQWLQRSGRGLAAAGLAALAPGVLRAEPDHTGGDPLGSMQWPQIRRKFTGQEALQFNPEILVQGPPFAEDAMNVPLQVDARALLRQGHEIDRIVLVADRNPVQQIASFMPHQARPVLALRFRLEQGSAVRALVRTRAGAWQVGQTWINAAGGGCTVPGATRTDGSWARTLNQVQARLFSNLGNSDGARLRVRIMHPMDTGLVAGVPAFHLEELELRDAADRLWWRLELHEPVAENPLLTFELDQRPPGRLWLQGRDNNGNLIRHEVQA